MSEKIVQFNEEIIKGQIKELVRGSVEETLNGKRSTTARIQSKPGRSCNPTGFVYSQSVVSRISWDGVLPS